MENVSIREQALFKELRTMILKDRNNEMLRLERKIKKLTEQRDEWKYQALKYRQLILEKK